MTKSQDNYLKKGVSLAGILLLVIITFPDFDPVYDSGIDAPMAWVFNYFFNGNMALSKEIIFPHGPLAFLLYPVPFGLNLEIAMAFYCLLAISFGLNFFRLSRSGKHVEILFTAILLWLLFSVFNLQLLIIGVVVSSFLLSIEKEQHLRSLLALFLAALAIFIKSYVGIVSGILVFSFIVADLVVHRKYTRSLLYLLFFFGSIVLIWLAMYQSLDGLLRYFKGIAELAGDNSAAAAFYPDNNWWYLSLSILCFLLIPLINQSRRVFIFYGLMLLASFAAWKHGMARQDVFHTGQFFSFLGLFTGLLLVYVRRRRLISAAMLMGSLVFFYLNFTKVLAYEDFRIDLWKAGNFTEVVTDFEKYKQRHLEISEENIEEQKLNEKVLELIGDRKVDIYPWDYTMIPANDLNWQPRPVIQSYAAYSSWLDLQNQLHFQSSEAPDFLLWELNRVTLKRYGEDMAGVDRRHLLNDEPQTILSILNQYEIVHRDEDVVLFGKRNDNLIQEVKSSEKISYAWNEWLSVPQVKDGFLRIKADIKPNLPGRLKSFLFKGEETFIYYKLNNGDILSYKIVPKNARDGVWVNPLLQNLQNGYREPEVVAVQFRSSNKQLMQDEIEFRWEHILLNDRRVLGEEPPENDLDYSGAFQVFAKTRIPEENMLFEAEFDFSETTMADSNISETDYLSPPQAYRILSREFSPGFSINLDSLLPGKSLKDITANASLWAKSSKFGGAVLVMAIRDQKEQVYWGQEALSEFVIDENDWNYTSLKIKIPEELMARQGLVLKVFVWNVEDAPILIDEFRISLKRVR